MSLTDAEIKDTAIRITQLILDTLKGTSSQPPTTTNPPPTTTPPPVTTPPVDNTVPLPNLTKAEQEFSARLGPTWAELNPEGKEDRPTLYLTPDVQAKDTSIYVRANPYNVGIENTNKNDYRSCSGQVIYVPDDPSANRGEDRIAIFGDYQGVLATSPRPDWASVWTDPNNPANHVSWRPEPALSSDGWYKQATQPLGMCRNDFTLQNEALVVHADGTITTAGTQTSRPGEAFPLPHIKFPPNKVPTGAIAVTSGNEFAVVGVVDSQTGKGELAIIALEGKWISIHTWAYMGLYNQGSWSAFKIMGYVPLSIRPDNVSAASNGAWLSPSQTNGQSPGTLPLSNPSIRNGFLNGTEANWLQVVASGGYAIVSSKSENKFVVVDLTPVIQYVRKAWLSDYDATAANRGDGDSQFPQVFTVNSSAAPKQVAEFPANKPTFVIAGKFLERWTGDYFKAHVACEDGTLIIVNTSMLMARFDWNKKAPSIGIAGTMTVGRNPVSMCFGRFNPIKPSTLIPANLPVDNVNNHLYIACRGDRRIDEVITFGGKGEIIQSIKDTRLGDPVHVSVTDRANLITVCSYIEKKILTFRLGKLSSIVGGISFGAGKDGNDLLELSGQMVLPGCPFSTCSANVN